MYTGSGGCPSSVCVFGVRMFSLPFNSSPSRLFQQLQEIDSSDNWGSWDIWGDEDFLYLLFFFSLFG